MTTWLTRCFAGLLLVLPFVPAVADDPDDKEIARLVKQLGSSDFRTRQAATKRLEEIGEPALDALGKATGTLEMRRRAEQIIAVTEARLYPELILTGGSVSVSADGKRVLTCDGKTLRLWDAYTGKCLRVFEGHTDGVIGAALSPDGKRVLSGSGDKTVRLWDADTGKELRQMTGHTTAVFSVAFGPEGKAISGGVGPMHLWDLNTGKQAAVFSVDGYIVALAYSAKARLAATYTWTRIRLWDLETGKEVRKWTGHGSDFYESVSFSPDGERLLSASPGGPVCIWDVKSGKGLKLIHAHKETDGGGVACCAAFSPDGKRVASGGHGGVCVWDAETGKELRKYEGHTKLVVSVAYFPDGKRIASASEDGTVRIWRAPR
jgi:WD40 repeat protein